MVVYRLTQKVALKLFGMFSLQLRSAKIFSVVQFNIDNRSICLNCITFAHLDYNYIIQFNTKFAFSETN